MICFICEVNVATLSSLVAHFKIIHLLKSFDRYICKENNCLKSFQNLSSFKKHVISKHNSFENISNVTKDNSTSFVNNLNVTDQTGVDKIVNNELTLDQPITKRSKPHQDNFDFNKCAEKLNLYAVQFCVALHNNNNFCNSDVIYIQNNIESNIIQPIISLIKNTVEEEIEDPLVRFKFSKVTSAICNIFKFCKTEYLLKNWLENNNLLEGKCKQFTINDEINLVSRNGQTLYDEVTTKGVLLPIRFQIKKFFELNNNLDTALKLYNDLINCPVSEVNFSMSNFIQGSLWKEKISSYQGKIVMPFFLYIDDVEINNPLGSKSMCHSISAVYYSFPLDKQNSKLTNIFLAALLKSKDLKKFWK